MVGAGRGGSKPIGGYERRGADAIQRMLAGHQQLIQVTHPR